MRKHEETHKHAELLLPGQKPPSTQQQMKEMGQKNVILQLSSKQHKETSNKHCQATTAQVPPQEIELYKDANIQMIQIIIRRLKYYSIDAF